MAQTISKKEYVDLYGPTEGDKVELADTGLEIEIEKDYTKGHYGDEVIAGSGNT